MTRGMLAFFALLATCGVAAAAGPTPAPAAAYGCAGQTGKVIFEDNFADDSGGWDIDQYTGYTKGAFQIKVDEKNVGDASLNLSFTATEGDYCVGIAFPSAPAETDNPDAASLTVLAADYDNRYSFGINTIGEAWVAHTVKGQPGYIMSFTKIPAIKTAQGAVNVLRVVVKDQKITFYINGEQVKVFRAPILEANNRFGFSARSTKPQKERTTLIKYFKVTQPQ
jgi:hypothetical protein